jgi:hypothetical protein
MESASFLDFFNAFWPVIVSLVGLIIILAKLHGRVEVIEDKIKTLFELWNNRNKQD